MNLSAFEANYQPTAIAKPEQTKKLSGVTGLAVNFLPTIAGGAGAALGSFVGPVGTAVGGAAGAGLGEYLRQKLTGEASDGIDKGNIVQESIFGALPGVGKGIKAVKTARAAEGGLAGAGGLRGVLTGGKLAKAAEEVVPAGKFIDESIVPMRGVEQISGKGAKLTRSGIVGNAIDDAATRSNNLQPVNTAENTITRATETAADARTRAAERFTGGSNGIKPGAKVGSQTLTAKRSSELNAHINANIGAKPTDAADTILRRNEAFIANKASELDSLLSQKNTLLEPNDYRKVLSGIKKPTGMNLVDNPTHLQLASDLQNVTDVKGLEKFRREIDDIVNFSRSEASPDPATERVALAWRKAIDKVVTNKIPESKEIKTALNRAFDTKTFIEPAARNAGGFGYGNIKIGGRALQGAKRATGQALDKLPDAIGVNLPKLNGNSFLARTAKAAIPQQGYRIGAEMLGIPPTNEQLVEQTSNTSLPTAETNGMTGSPAVDMLQSSTAGMPTLEQVQAYLASGGKIDDVAKYVALAEKLSPASKTNNKKTEAMRARDEAADLTAKAIEQLAAGSIDTGIVGSKVQGAKEFFGKGDQETIEFNTTISALRAAIAKARAGTSMTPGEKKMLDQYTPKPGDTGQQLRTKLLAMQDIYEQSKAREAVSDYTPDIVLGTR